jgi:hypothetical protein
LALQVNENIIITGDLNSNILCSNNNKLIDLVNIFNLKNVIDKPTRISGNTSTFLDPIIENATLPQFDSKTNNIIHEIHITENEIIDVIQILDPNKATGPDKINHKMLKISPEKIAKPLLIIFNKSFTTEKISF